MEQTEPNLNDLIQAERAEGIQRRTRFRRRVLWSLAICDSILLGWGAISPRTVAAVFPSWLADCVMLSYLGLFFVAMALIARSGYRIFTASSEILRRIAYFAATLLWFAYIVFCLLLMAVRTGI